MLHQQTTPPEGVHLLADHLDAALAAGEDLMAVRLQPAADAREDEAPEDLLARFVGQVRQDEAALLLRLLQARRRAEAVTSADAALRSVLRLVIANTNALLELAQQYGDRDVARGSGEDAQQFLRRRGLIAEDAPAVGAFETVTISDGFRVCGVIPLGGLLDMAAAALDLLDRQYDLYKTTDDDDDADVARAATVDADGVADLTVVDPVLVASEPAVAPATSAAATDVETAGDTPSPGSLRAALKELSQTP